MCHSVSLSQRYVQLKSRKSFTTAETPHPMSDAAPLIDTSVVVLAATHAYQPVSSTIALHHTHPMSTRSQQNIYKPKRPTDGTDKCQILYIWTS
jgi:hypothetical protein